MMAVGTLLMAVEMSGYYGGNSPKGGGSVSVTTEKVSTARPAFY